MEIEILIPAALFLLALFKKGARPIQVELVDPTGKRIMVTVDANNPPIGWNGLNVIPMDQLAKRGADGGPNIPQNVVAASRITGMTDAQRLTAYNFKSDMPDFKTDPTGYINYSCKTDPAAFNLQLGFKCINGMPINIVLAKLYNKDDIFTIYSVLAFNPDARLTDAEIAKYNEYHSSYQPKLFRDTMLVQDLKTTKSAPRSGI